MCYHRYGMHILFIAHQRQPLVSKAHMGWLLLTSETSDGRLASSDNCAAYVKNYNVYSQVYYVCVITDQCIAQPYQDQRQS